MADGMTYGNVAENFAWPDDDGDVAPNGTYVTPTAEDELEPHLLDAWRKVGAWMAAEVLEPTSFDDLKAVAEGTRRASEFLPLSRGGKLSWDQSGVESKPFSHYDILLGWIRVSDAYKNSAICMACRRNPAGGKGVALLATLRLNEHGIMMPLPLSISSFGWGLAKAMQGDLRPLSTWPEQAAAIQDKFKRTLRQIRGVPLPIEAVREILLLAA